MTPRCTGQLRVKKLSSGYWHVQFGPCRFAQWKTGELCTAEDVFGGGGDEEQLAEEANKAAGSWWKENRLEGAQDG